MNKFVTDITDKWLEEKTSDFDVCAIVKRVDKLDKDARTDWLLEQRKKLK